MNKTLVTLIASALGFLLLSLGVTQEVPVGTLGGRVTMAENGRPLGHALVVLTTSNDDTGAKETDEYVPEEVRERSNWHTRTDENGAFLIRNLPAGPYTVEVVAKEHSLEDKHVTVMEGRRNDVDVRLDPQERYLTMYLSQKVLAPHRDTKLEIKGFLPSDHFTLSAYRLKLPEVASAGGAGEALSFLQDGSSDFKKEIAKRTDKFWATTQHVTKTDAEGAFVENYMLPALPEGLYYVRAESADHSSGAFVNVTNISLVTKSSNKRALCYVTDIDTGQPIPGAKVLEMHGSKLEQVGETDAKGLYQVNVQPVENKAVLIAEANDSTAVCGFEMGSNDDGGDSDEPTDPSMHVFTYADRPVYRPGDAVQFKAVVRKLAGTEYRLPKKGMATIQIYDPNENLLETQSLPLSSHGALHGSFKTNPEAQPGVYKIEVSADGGKDDYYANFAAYRKPDYSIKVTANKPRYVIGDKASATISCQYFFGGPVVGAKVNVSVTRSPDWESEYAQSDSDDSDDDSDDQGADESYSGGEGVTDVQAVTDGNGNAVVEFDTQPEDATDPDFSDYRYSIEANVDEASGKSFEGSGSFKVSRGSFGLSAKTDTDIASPGQDTSLTLRTFDLDTPSKAVPGRRVSLTIGTQTWTEGAVVFEAHQNLTVTTGQDGTVKIPLKIGGAESLTIRAKTVDDGGRTIQAETFLYVEGGALPDSQSTLSIKLDRKQYNVGDTVKALIVTNSPGGTALLTIEADGVRSSQLVPMTKSSQIVRLPVTADMSPNVFVGVAYVNKREFSQSSRRILVKRADLRLNVSVQPDRPKALPGSTVLFHIQTTDQAGHGTPADVSLGVVDESIYAIKPDSTDIAKGLFPEVPDLVETNYSFPVVYLDGGDKAGGSVPVRRKFMDTADWKPDVETDSKGQATVAIKLPDNLTSWRATAVAATDETAVGMSTANVQASKPLMVRLECPQFMVAGDSQRLMAAITNDTDADQDVNLRLTMSGLQTSDDLTQKVHLQRGETQSVPIEVTAPVSGAASIVAEAVGNGASDAVEGKFPISPHGRLIKAQFNGAIGKEAVLNLDALATRDRNAGALNITVTPSVLSGMFQSLDTLVQYPYGCVEQTMSRFLPAVLVTHAIKGTNFESARWDARTVRIAADGFARLQKMQHEDGAWGWWTYDESNPFMTAWVLDGLKRLDKAGFASPPSLDVSKALEWSKERLNKPFSDDALADRLYLIYALAEYDEKDAARSSLKQCKLGSAGVGELALAALGANACGEKGIRDESLDRLAKRLDGNDLKSDTDMYIWSANEHLALALVALTELTPGSPQIVKLATQLLQNRGCDGWESTRETSLAIVGLTNYIREMRQTVRKSTIVVSLNGKLLRRVEVDPTRIDSPSLTIRVPVSALADGANKLELSASGGAPYYSAELDQYDVQPHLGQILSGSGVSVERNYYVMQAKTLENGETKLLPSATPVDQAKTGDIIRCEITLRCDRPVDYLMVEDPIPSNCHVTDREDPDEGEDWTFWWCSLVIRDDRVSFFARQMPAGTHRLAYSMRAEEKGVANAMPTTASNMYLSSQSGSGGENRLEVLP